MDTEISYAGIMRRVLASVIDVVLWVTIAFVIIFFLYFLHHSSASYNDADDTHRTVIPMVILMVILPVYIMFNILMTARLGGTPGKLLCGIYIKDASTFTNVTLKQATIRYLFKDGIWTVYNFLSDPFPDYVSGCLFIVLISVLMFAILDQRKQTFYDKIAKTVVINYEQPVKYHPNLNYVGIARRIIAYIIDCFIIMGICLVFFSLARIAFDSDGSGLLAICLYFLLSIVFGIFMVRRFSGTPGQLLCSIHIKDINTLENITLVQATTRYVLSKVPVLFILSFIVIVGIIGESLDSPYEWWFLLPVNLASITIIIAITLIFICAIFDQCKQTFYDKIAKTVVVDYKPS